MVHDTGDIRGVIQLKASTVLVQTDSETDVAEIVRETASGAGPLTTLVAASGLAVGTTHESNKRNHTRCRRCRRPDFLRQSHRSRGRMSCR